MDHNHMGLSEHDGLDKALTAASADAAARNNIVSDDGKVATQRGPVREAVDKVRARLGLLPDQ